MMQAQAPSVTGLSLDSGPVGTTVTISGSGFGPTQGSSTVKFGGATAPVTSWSKPTIVVTVPDVGVDVSTNVNVIVTVAGLSSQAVVFKVTVSASSIPSISNLSQDTGPVGAAITITGSNFGSTQGTSTVTFNGLAGAPTSWSATSIVVPVPSGATTGNVVVTVGGQASNGVAFTVAPHINSMMPTASIAGATVSISGTTFGDTQRTSTVTFNGATATAANWSANSITVTVPATATTGNVVVTVGGVASNGLAFMVAPFVSGLSPASGIAGTPVTITGSGFGATQGTSAVTFNGVTAAPTSWSATSISVPAPAGVSSGNVVVTVGGVPSSGATFTVAPHINSMMPTAGVAGATVSISGTNFGATQGTSTVTFNGTTAAPASWSAGSITVTVPATATTGNVVVTVGGVSSNGVNFAVGAGVPNISSLSPATGSVGTAVTITGTGFGATQGASTVVFNTTGATPTSWSNTQIVVPVPSGATSGNVVVTVAGQASNVMSFTVGQQQPQQPHINSITPSAGIAGTSVTIAGTNFGTAPGTVTFNITTAANPTWSDTQIVVAVPNGATTGNVVVTNSGGGSNGVLFTIQPHITGVSPASGGSNASITISGTNFGSAQGASTIAFNGTVVPTPNSWSDTQIVASVPSAATTGNIVVTVANQASNGFPFTVLPHIFRYTLSQGTDNPNGNIHQGPALMVFDVIGANFGNGTNSKVEFVNGASGTRTQMTLLAGGWSNGTIRVQIPAALRPAPGTTTPGTLVVTTPDGASNALTFNIMCYDCSQ